ncbi:hypothetical protein MMC11_006775 [Xylographa trunciseda]|nr:hypothetical protein [Xylographa trunciseda]
MYVDYFYPPFPFSSSDDNLIKPDMPPTATTTSPVLEKGAVAGEDHNGHAGLPETEAIHKRDPHTTNAYLVGGGIASLAAAVHLIHDAHVPASQIHILESSPVPGGSMDGSGTPTDGYILRGGRMLNFSYLCLYDLLSQVPSLKSPKHSVMKEIEDFNLIPGNRTHAHARLVAGKEQPPEVVDVKRFGLSAKEKWSLVKMIEESEKTLGTKRIEDYFHDGFFKTNFWFMFAFQPWHSAVEFRRYLHRFIHEFPRLNTLAGVDRTPYNQFESIILPIAEYLKSEGVDFQYDTKATNLSFAQGEGQTITQIHTTHGSAPKAIPVLPTDVVILTLGSMTADSSIGTNTRAPLPTLTALKALDAPDGAWAFWDNIARDQPSFGNPDNFYSRIEESNWESFTITLHSHEFLDRVTTWSGNKPGTGALVTFKDSAWLMSIVVPHQPHFVDQPADVQVLWGYGLFPSREGDFVKKSMAACSGQEILTELLGHLDFPLHPIVDDAITIPVMMPYITAQFLTRSAGDRPQVIPKGSTNFAFVGQFVEIPDDVVFTVEYSVRGAQMAVCELMGTGKQPKRVYKGDKEIFTMAEALETLLFH